MVKKTKGKREGRGEGGEEDRMKKEKEKRVGIKYLDKRNDCVGTELVHWYIYRHFSNFNYH